MRLLAGARRAPESVWTPATAGLGCLGLRRPPRLLRDAVIDETFFELPEAPEGEEVIHDYATMGLTLRNHSLALQTSASTRPCRAPGVAVRVRRPRTRWSGTQRSTLQTCNNRCSRSQGEITFMNSACSSSLISAYTVTNAGPSTLASSLSLRSSMTASPRLRGSACRPW